MTENTGAPAKSPAQKLQVKPGQRILLLNAPEDARLLLGQLPGGAEFAGEPGGPADIVLLFAHHRADLEARLPAARDALAPKGILWVAYHKGTSGVKTDINRDIIWRFSRTVGMDAVSMVSINDDWSAMRLKFVPSAQEGRG